MKSSSYWFPSTTYALWSAGFCLLGMVGCTPLKREDLVNQVLGEDPGFTQVLDKHRELATRIETCERELDVKRKAVERKIKQLRQELAEATAVARHKIAEVKRLIEPDRKRIEQALSEASVKLHTAQTQRVALAHSISKLRQTLDDKQINGTPQARAEQNTQLEEMLRDAKRLDQEISDLKEHVRRLKMKFLLIAL